VAAKSQYGWGPTGPVTPVYAAAVPDPHATPPATAAEAASVRISWEPATPHGLPVTEYSVRVQAYSADPAVEGAWLEPPSCTGDADAKAAIVSALSCLVPMV
jgi:hypothetical protein